MVAPLLGHLRLSETGLLTTLMTCLVTRLSKNGAPLICLSCLRCYPWPRHCQYSIQAYPDKELAKALHKSMPNIYKDDNYKPEMALVLTHFQALCGFITLEELKKVIGNVPEIVEMVGSEVANQVLCITKEDGEDKVKSVIRLIFTQLMSTDKEIITTVTTKLMSRLHQESQVRQLTEKEQLVLQLEKQYPNDVGVISAFFLNYVKLNPGEALCLGANEPRAYISGDY